ncbi:MAG: DUF3786 domain-containing protein [Desulfobacteraceae bacterium]|nr:DUF3786 domain-containing protein [Desulfobacteraceae bacterium]
MTEFANAMEVFKLLDKSNCRKCNEQTCLAFASKVFLGERHLNECPALSHEIIGQYQGRQKKKQTSQEYRESLLSEVKEKIKDLDLEQAAKRVGGTFLNGQLTLRIFGKPFSIDQQGNMVADIHINPWIAAPVLGYVLRCKGVPLTGKWVPMRELKGGREKNALFVQRSEKSLKKIADTYTGLFEDLMVLFNGKKVENHYESDISLVLYPLPKLPLLICYRKAEESMASDLHLFFDSSADMNADIDIVHGIAAGIIVMFEKISMKHGFK